MSACKLHIQSWGRQRDFSRGNRNMVSIIATAERQRRKTVSWCPAGVQGIQPAVLSDLQCSTSTVTTPL